MIDDIPLEQIELALWQLPRGHTVIFVGQQDGRATFVRRDGLALHVYNYPSLPGWSVNEQLSADIAPSEATEGYDALGYPSKDGALRDLLLWFHEWDGQDINLLDLLETQ